MAEMNCGHEGAESHYKTKDYELLLCPTCFAVLMMHVLNVYNSLTKDEKAKFHELTKAVRNA